MSVCTFIEQVDGSGSATPLRLDNASATRLVSTLGVVTMALTKMPEPIAPAVEARILQ